MKIWSNDIVCGHGYLTPGKRYDVIEVFPRVTGAGRGFCFIGDNERVSFSVEFGSSHLNEGGKWIIEEDE